jgi:anhydro-N-acetylmuramic acid kinase
MPLYVGLMSGTSVDAIDCALMSCQGCEAEVLATCEYPIPQRLKNEIAALSQPGANEIERMGVLDRELGALFASAALSLLKNAHVDPGEVAAIGTHGQTVRHRPASITETAQPGFTLQIGDPNTIAEVTGITTVADFRRRDIAAGGEGAPLAPAFHAATLSAEGVNRAIVNIGGIANATLLKGNKLLAGFDTGPGNTLLDHWIQENQGEECDRDGRWSAAGNIDEQLLKRLLTHPFFTLTGPRSTGKEAFNLPWLKTLLEQSTAIAPRDVQTTLVEFTAKSIALAIASQTLVPTEVFVCGGGAHNTHLMQRLAVHTKPARLATTAALGLEPDWVEAAAFAWLACQTLASSAGNAPVVTGAAGERILGGIYPGGAPVQGAS